MGSYQYYEFVAIDRPLTSAEMGELRQLTSRSEISPTRLSNIYHYGSFKGDPVALMHKHFDAMLYLDNWGTRRLMFKLSTPPARASDFDAYRREGSLKVDNAKDHILLILEHRDEDEGGWIEDAWAQSWMPALVPLRAELLRGELGAAYVAWLSWAGSQGTDDGADLARTHEPEVPAGLHRPSAALTSLAQFLKVPDDWLAAAGEGAPEPLEGEPVEARALAWLRAVPATQRNAWLARVVMGQTTVVEAEVRRGFAEATQARRGGAGHLSPRSIEQLQRRAQLIHDAREQEKLEADARAREAAKQAEEAARAKRLSTLKRNPEAAWRTLEAGLEERKAAAYDQALSQLLDLRALAEREGTTGAFESRVAQLEGRHAGKTAFVRRLREHGLPKRR
jgi:hypothetical protein